MNWPTAISATHLRIKGQLDGAIDEYREAIRLKMDGTPTLTTTSALPFSKKDQLDQAIAGVSGGYPVGNKIE